MTGRLGRGVMSACRVAGNREGNVPMCSNPEKARFRKTLVEEIRAELAKRQARKAAAQAKAPAKAWPGKADEPALAGYRR